MAKMYMQGVRPVYPVRLTGKWENITPSHHFTLGGDPVVRCPVCKDPESIHLGGVEGSQWKFCPVCGAQMEVPDENQI